MNRRQFLAIPGAYLLNGCDAMMETVVSSNPPEGAIQLQKFSASAPMIRFSDFAELSVTQERARFSRFADPYGQGYGSVCPGARVRIATSSPVVHFRLQFTNLVQRLDTYNGVGVVLVDGAHAATFSRDRGEGPLTVEIEFEAAAVREIDLVFPYCASVDLLGVDTQLGYPLMETSVRPSTRFVAVGDSITHGFVASRVDLSWPYRLAGLKGWQLINMGYGSHQVIPSVVEAAAQLSPAVGTYLIGYNDFAVQTPLATFKALYRNAALSWRFASPSAPLYCITPLYSANTGSNSLESYRQQIRDVVAELSDPFIRLVEGVPLATNDAVSFPDAVHPSDAAAASIASSLAAVVSVT